MRLPRLRQELVTENERGSSLFKRWWNSVMDQIDSNDTEVRALIDALEESFTATAEDNDSRYLRGDGTIAASAATTTHKIPWVHPASGVTYYILLSNV